ncbi:signal transduction protein Syg1 [Paecilomyces variotii No. 5]|uniref:Signal transduction protein Syg1 n=1 Tax=Byssochlamys spectabilis (strain No. 5 / NBRC 109023) TaxID=1356009 RepID=V5GCA3_BYSSN|nr:signal transduction protein Syg1 [Paecilomyces variotii No. 5]
MKFAKELEEQLVPEWRAKYLDYKAGKKKLKALNRALQRINRTPRTPQTPLARRFTQSLATNETYTPTRGPDRFSAADADNNGTPRSRATPVPVPERQPLKRTGSRFASSVGSYGSILATPPAVAEVPELPSLELPDPAIDPRDKYNFEGETADDKDDDAPTPSPRIRKTVTLDAETRSSRDGGSIPGSSRKKGVGFKGASSPTNSSIRRPSLLKRVLSNTGDWESPRPGKGYQDARTEFERRQDEFFEFLDSELDKIETFYKMKEEEASNRLQVLRQQLHTMRDRRIEEVLAARKGIKQNSNGNGHGNGVPGIPGAKWKLPVGPRFGKNSKALAQMMTPSAPAPMDYPAIADRRDFTRRPESDGQGVPYRSAKRKLKLALQEFYRGLELLKAYTFLNRTAFRKINKKYDKTVFARPPMRYMTEKVNKAYFVQSEILESHIIAVEDLYARYFERGNRKIAVGKLRNAIQKSGDYSGNTFLIGLMIAAGLVFGIQGLVYAAQLLFDPDPVIHMQTSYLLQIYAGLFLIIFHFFLFCLDCMIWTKTKINYSFVFEFDSRHVLDWRQLTEFPSFCFFLMGLFMWLNFSWVNWMYIYWPVILIFITVLVIFFPAPVLYHRSRKWWAYSNWRLLLAGLYPVEFRDFFLGDMYCSQTYSMGNIELFFCLYALGWHNTVQCNSSHSRLLGFFTTLPSIWRGLQCLRRYRDSRSAFPHLANFAKYTCGILYYMTLSLYRIHKYTRYQALFITFAFVNAIYTSVWDIAMDWSLCNPYAKNRFLREILAFRKAWIYYVAMVLDVVVRFNWIFYAIFASDLQHSAVLSFLVSLSEVCRRGMWTIFRVENEHCTNVHLFRASRDVPLPYPIPSELPPGPAEVPSVQDVQLQERPTTAAPTAGSTSIDVEHGLQPGMRPSIRQRHMSLVDGINRIGNIVTSAHAQDFVRKKKPDPLSGNEMRHEESHTPDTSEDEDEGDSGPADEAEAAILDELPSPRALDDHYARH